MAEVINTNVFDANKKFVDFSGLDYFWTKAKNYIDGVDTAMSAKVVTLENTVGDSTKGLVKDVKSIQDELNSLSGGAGSIATQIDNAIAALDLPNTYEAKGEAAKAEAAAKSYADGLAGNYDAAGAAAAVDSKLTTHTDNGDIHITADERTSWNAAKSAIDAFLKDADMTEKAVDTLAELQTYMTTDGAAAAELIGRVATLEAIDHDAYVAADETVLASAKSYADGLASNYDAAGAAATAKSEAIADADGKLALKANAADVYVKDTVDSKVSAAQSAAIAQAKLDAAEALKAYYTKEEANAAFDAAGSAATAQTAAEAYAKTYTDQLYASFKFAANSDIDAIFA